MAEEILQEVLAAKFGSDEEFPKWFLQLFEVGWNNYVTLVCHLGFMCIRFNSVIETIARKSVYLFILDAFIWGNVYVRARYQGDTQTHTCLLWFSSVYPSECLTR